MKNSMLSKAFLLLFSYVLFGATTQTSIANNGYTGISQKGQPDLILNPNQLVVNAVVPVRYDIKSDVKLSDNTLLANTYGLRVRVDGSKKLPKGTGTFNVKVNGIAPSEPGDYFIKVESGKMKSEIWLSVPGTVKAATESENPDVTEIKTTGTSFTKSKDITITIKKGSPAVTLEYYQLLGSANGIEIRYEGNSHTYLPGKHTVPATIKGGSGVTTNVYSIPLNEVSGITNTHRVMLMSSPTINRLKCNDVEIFATSGTPFFEPRSIAIDLNARTTMSLSPNQLLGSANGIEVRYSGAQQTFYPGENYINVSVSGGSTIEPGSYSIILNNVPELASTCSIKVNVGTGVVQGKIKTPAMTINAPQDRTYSEKREITITIESGSVNLNDYALIGYTPGIHVRYRGQSKVYSPGIYTLSVIVDVDGPSIGKGTHSVPLNLISGINPQGDVKVSIN